MSNSKKKNSLLVGGLTSSAGLFITKAIGLLYVAPFRAMVGSSDYVYYAAGYELYDLMLTISLAGLPFAIAAIVSKYIEKEDYRTVMLVKKLSQGLLAVFGFIAATVVVIFINQFINTRGTISIEEAKIYRNVYLIMTLSIFTVPILSSFRGFFQGVKDYGTYSASQVIEQVVRVVFLLGLGSLLVYILDFERIYAVYVALFASAFSAIAAIFYLAFIKRDVILEIQAKADEQFFAPVAVKNILLELFVFALPYLLSVILSSRVAFVNMALLPNALNAFGYDTATTQIYTSLITNETLKLVGIPTVLATGFSVAVIPEMSQALVRNDYAVIRRNVRAAIESVLFISLPFFLILFFMSDEVYFILFGGSSEIIKMGGAVTKVHVLYGIISILTPVIVSITMTLKLVREAIVALALAFGFNFILLKPLVMKFGWSGSFIAAFIPTVFFILAILYIIKRKFAVNFNYTYRRLLLMVIASTALVLVYGALRLVGLPVISLGKFFGLITLGIYSLAMLATYLFVSHIFMLPQVILNINFGSMIKRVLKRWE